MFVQLHSSFLTLLCSRGRSVPHAPNMARTRWEFWGLILILIPFKEIKSPAFLWLEEFFLWSSVLNMTWGFCCSWVPSSHNPAVRLQLLCGLVLTCSFRIWACRQVTKWGKTSGCLFTAPEPSCGTSQFTLPRGWKHAWKEPSKEGGNLAVFVLLAQGNCWCRARSWVVNVLQVSNTWAGRGPAALSLRISSLPVCPCFLS